MPLVLSPAQFAVLQKHYEAQQALAYWKAEEMRLRLICVAGMGSPDKQDGDETKVLEGGWVAKISKTLNYKLDRSKTRAAEAELQHDIASELIGWSPSLAIGVYKKLDQQSRLIIEPALTITPGAPTFTMVPPTKDKVI